MWHSESRRVTAKGARRPLIVAAIVGGAVLQHLIVPAPTPPARPGHPAHAGSVPAPVSAPTRGATRP